jgi:hypothetical protein
MTFEFHPEARAEFHDAAHWYEDRSLFAGGRFVSSMRAATKKCNDDRSATLPAWWVKISGSIV